MSRPNSYLDLTGATISPHESSDEELKDGEQPHLSDSPGPASAFPEEAPSINLPQQSTDLLHFAIDIGGSLIKLVYFLPGGGGNAGGGGHGAPPAPPAAAPQHERRRSGDSFFGGRLLFTKFETTQLDEAIEFIEAAGLHKAPGGSNAVLKATGGGAHKFAARLADRLGLTLQKEDEMRSVVRGANFLLRAIRDEAFTYFRGKKEFVAHRAGPPPPSPAAAVAPPKSPSAAKAAEPLYPYLLVNIGSGVSILRVDGENNFRRVSGTNVGGGTFWGLCRLLTGVRSFDEMLALSERGDNSKVDMLVGDIYGGIDYSNVGLSAQTIASSFGKVAMDDLDLGNIGKEDMALSLLRMISYNIGHLGVLNAMSEGVERIFFGGFFIRGHPFTMETISFAVDFWSQGKLKAMYLRHEGFLGALGAFMSFDEQVPPVLRTGGSWIEKFLAGASEGAPRPRRRSQDREAAEAEMERALAAEGEEAQEEDDGGLEDAQGGLFPLGVLHLCPKLLPFPLLRHAEAYEPDTFRLGDPEERDYWVAVLERHLPTLVEKAVASEGGGATAQGRGAAFSKEFKEHLARLSADASTYGKLGVAGLLEMREECLRAHRFADAYASVKRSENEAALAALPDLLAELDQMGEAQRVQALVEGNIFDWGAKACVDLYKNGTILDIYRRTRSDLRRPFGIDELDAFQHKLAGGSYRKAVVLCDNAGADIVLGVLPLARELLRRGTSVVLAANSMPALNDVTKPELNQLLLQAADLCPVLSAGLRGGDGGGPSLVVRGNGSGSPCIDLRRVSVRLCEAAADCDLLVIEGMGRAIHTNFGAEFTCDTLKLAMIKNERVASSLFGGKLYDCVVKFEPAAPASPR